MEMILLTSVLEKARGLLGKSPPKCIVFLCPCNSIHTFFMKYRINVAFINKHGVVIQVIRNMPPCKKASNPKAVCVAEQVASAASMNSNWFKEGAHIFNYPDASAFNNKDLSINVSC